MDFSCDLGLFYFTVQPKYFKIKNFMDSWLSVFCDKYFADCKKWYRSAIQDKIFKRIHKFVKSIKNSLLG